MECIPGDGASGNGCGVGKIGRTGGSAPLPDHRKKMKLQGRIAAVSLSVLTAGLPATAQKPFGVQEKWGICEPILEARFNRSSHSTRFKPQRV